MAVLYLEDPADSLVLSQELQEKAAKLRALFAEMGSVAVAYSGGVDSTLVAKVAHDTLGDKMLAVIAVSESLGEGEYAQAVALLERHQIPFMSVATNEVHDPAYAANPVDRCYHCKQHVNSAILDVAQARGFACVADGFNADDVGDYRPGRKAGRELGVRSPLYEANFTKYDIRVLAQHYGLDNWDKPAMACLSSRVPYGMAITPEMLKQIDRAETYLRQMGFRQVRVRHHEALARIEAPMEEFDAMMGMRDAIVDALKQTGYTYVTLDLQGFRSGSANEALLQNRG